MLESGDKIAIIGCMKCLCRRRDVLQFALKKERDSITFYTGLKGFVDEAGALAKINDIIGEELKHIELLTSRL